MAEKHNCLLFVLNKVSSICVFLYFIYKTKICVRHIYVVAVVKVIPNSQIQQ